MKGTTLLVVVNDLLNHYTVGVQVPPEIHQESKTTCNPNRLLEKLEKNEVGSN